MAEDNAFANLPNMRDGSGLVTQSSAVIMYAARKCALAGADDAQQTKIEMVLFDVYDLRDAMCNMVYMYWYKGFCRDTAEFEEQKAKYFPEKANAFFDKQEKWLGQNGTTYFAGNAPTAADLHVWEQLDHRIDFACDVGVASPLEGRDKLKAFYKAFRALPQLANCFESTAASLPCNVPEFSFWSGKSSAVPADAPQAA